ncbi:LytR C-terminal domain-containing protein [Williamsia deligens]|uniref:LytR C-terminal domain-containing protein n=1 Tax=Williamsia deligens TaxID=321325 RepID=A0ABW3G680_9NOCA|nr:LytR C-terminal domain-containing protein [Williamsia deligens]MCP2193173.1 LytR cell envelope-related transcriptional attenuator [Williamsia deligens]
MTPERDSDRLPLRAGAMLLLAVAVVFVGLGWHSAASSGNSPEADLRAAAASESTAPSTSGAPSSTTAASSGSLAPSAAGESSASTSGPLVCVYNAGTITGLAVEVTDALKAKGYRTSAPGNLSTSSITENTVFYTASQRAEAQKVASDLDGGASIDARPSAFTQCRGGIAVVVLTR